MVVPNRRPVDERGFVRVGQTGAGPAKSVPARGATKGMRVVPGRPRDPGMGPGPGPRPVPTRQVAKAKVAPPTPRVTPKGKYVK